ncbi:MAG TPA: FMN-binding negative transcriptional regulator [Polyangiaceae bacterium]|nr:FMN-binding negative transcriptional regulator [Polyangiaceae bacterium]
MYVPNSFKVDDQAQIEAFLERYAFASIVSPAANGIVASQVPLVVRRAPMGLVLVGHVARANSHWALMDGASESLAIFQGPHGYVSPTWYASGPAVPTWNYATVHAYGHPRVIHDLTFTEDLLRELVLRYESGDNGWRVEDLPRDFSQSLLSAIVAFEMPIHRLETKFKLGQNRSAEDRAGTIAGLEREQSSEAHALASFMRAQSGLPALASGD